MSHFSVLVIGEDIDRQLAPYHEFECTDRDDEYVQDIDITNELLTLVEAYRNDGEEDPVNAALEEHGLNESPVDDESQVDKTGDHKYGYAVVRDGQIIKAVNRTNPNRKWDWYVIGGRWNGLFKLRTDAMAGSAANTHVNQARKGDIDWEAMRDEAGARAADQWDLVRRVAPMMWESWETIRVRHQDVETARQAYHRQEGRCALSGDLWVSDDILVPRDEFVRQARQRACTTFAVIRDGTWYERGKMGWWGMVADELDANEWHAHYARPIDDLPDDTILTVVDCHI